LEFVKENVLVNHETTTRKKETNSKSMMSHVVELNQRNEENRHKVKHNKRQSPDPQTTAICFPTTSNTTSQAE
jgi:hypothetical protein